MTARKDPYKLVSGPVPLVNIGRSFKASAPPRALFVRPSMWRRIVNYVRGVR